MDLQNTPEQMLSLIDQPAFAVLDGHLTHVNHAAAGLLLEVGAEVSSLIRVGLADYESFTEGRLLLTLGIGKLNVSASVHPLGEYHLFVLDTPESDAAFRAYALAAQELRGSVSGLSAAVDHLIRMLPPELSSSHQTAGFYRSLNQIVRTIGNMSDAGRFALGYSRMAHNDLAALFYEILSAAAVKCSEAEIHLEFEVPREPVYTLSDPDMLERALWNLLSNAMKFTPKGGTIRARLIQKKNRLYFTMLDNGTGVDDRIGGNLFRMYRRSPSIEDGRFGLGLGMVLVQGTAAAHGGTVLLEKPADGGCRITMTIEVRTRANAEFRSPAIRFDYAGEMDHALLELSDVLPLSSYQPEK